MIVWIIAAALELLILVRAFLGRTLTKYPFFYLYLSCVLAADVTRYIVYRSYASSYQNWYWVTEFICVILGYGVLLEIIEEGLRRFEGVRKIARNVGLAILGAVVCLGTIQAMFRIYFSAVLTSIEVERNLRFAELIILACALVAFVYYRIPITRNLKGIIFGYGLFVGIEVMDQATRSFLGQPFHEDFSVIRSYSFAVALVIWTAALWSLSPNPSSAEPKPTEADYHSFALRTRESIGDMRSHLERASRP
jgi:hypothetical protein